MRVRSCTGSTYIRHTMRVAGWPPSLYSDYEACATPDYGPAAPPGVVGAAVGWAGATGWAGASGCCTTIGELPVVRPSSSVRAVLGATNQRLPFLSSSPFRS